MRGNGYRNDVVLLIGAPRSGTTWLGKIFDSHPRVVYRHEPGAVSQCVDFPFIVPQCDFPRYTGLARAYVEHMCDVRSVRVAGKRPIFDKVLTPGWRGTTRHVIISLLQSLRRVPILGTAAGRVPVPDLISPRVHANPVYAIKSVISLGRAGLYHFACPDTKIVLIVRHPCGFVASELRGIRSGKLSKSIPVNALVSSEAATRHGLTSEQFEKMDLVEQLSWTWSLMNEKALLDLRDSPRVKIVLHDSICQQPLKEAHELFAFCGLEWNQQTEAFLATSTSSAAKSSYYSIHRDSSNEAQKWKLELDEQTIGKICSIARQSVAGKLFEME